MANTLKINKLTKSDYHSFVSPAFCAYRRKMHDAIKLYSSDYFRLFTEKRMRGVRTKYWMSRRSLPVQRIFDYINQNPTFTAGGRTYAVSADYTFGDFAIYCNAINN